MDSLIFPLLKDLDFPTDRAFLQASQVDPQVAYLHAQIWISEAKKHHKKSQTSKLEYLYFLKYKITQINSQITPGQILHRFCTTLTPTDLQKKYSLLELLF